MGCTFILIYLESTAMCEKNMYNYIKRNRDEPSPTKT